MILTAHQPSYLPWLGLFYKISLCDSFCVFNEVQFEAKGFDNRNRIKTSHGVRRLTVPVHSAGKSRQLCKDVRIVNNQWQHKHLKTIRLAYSKAKFFNDYFGQIEEILLRRQYVFLADINFELLSFGLKVFGLSPKIQWAHDFSFAGKKSELVLDMCRQLGAQEYIFGGEGSNYADTASFKAAGIVPKFLTYQGVEYRQLHGPYVSGLSFIDLLFNEGPRSPRLLTESRAVISVPE